MYKNELKEAIVKIVLYWSPYLL